MTNSTIIGVDLAKNSFSTCELNAAGRVVRRRDFKRDDFAAWLTQLPEGTMVGMEACGSGHYWARCCRQSGLRPRLIPPHLVTPFRKSRAIKNDRNDAEAVAIACSQPNMRFVPIKDVDQQARLSWHRAREGCKADKIATGNRIRGLLAEFGVVMPRGEAALKRVLADLEAYADLPGEFKVLVRALAEQWKQAHKALLEYTARINTHAENDPRCQRIGGLVGVGPITADAVVATIGSAGEFKNGRQLAAWLGLVPSQHSTGGRIHLGSITGHGDRYLRSLLVQGGRSSVNKARAVSEDKATPEQRWIRDLLQRKSFGKTVVAIANKHARQIWIMLARDVDYDPHACLHHPMNRVQEAA